MRAASGLLNAAGPPAGASMSSNVSSYDCARGSLCSGRQTPCLWRCRWPGKWDLTNSALHDALQVSMKEQLVRALGKTLSNTWCVSQLMCIESPKVTYTQSWENGCFDAPLCDHTCSVDKCMNLSKHCWSGTQYRSLARREINANASSVSTANARAVQDDRVPSAAVLPEELFSIEEDKEPTNQQQEQQQDTMSSSNDASMSFLS